MKTSIGMSLGLLVAVAFYGCQAEERSFGDPLAAGGTTVSPNGGEGDQPSQGGSANVGEGGAGNTLGGSGNTTDVVAGIEAMPELVGYETMVDGSNSSLGTAGPLTFAWTIDAVPDGSTVDTTSLNSTSDSAPTFFPDLGGDYTVGLTVTNADAQTDSTTLTFTVPTLDVPYFAVSGNASGSTRTPSFVKSDGTGGRELGCFFTEPAASEQAWLRALSDVGQFDIDSFYSSDPMQPSRLAFMRVDPANQNGPKLLQLASSATDCDQEKPPEITAGRLPRFSPNGKRVAFFTAREVVTATSAGTGVRIVRPAGAANSHTLTIAPPFWVDDATVGWLELDDNGDQVIYSAPDEADGFNNLLKRKVLTNCGEVVSPFFKINQVGMSSAGLIISARPVAISDPTNLFLLKDPGGEKYSCLRVSVSNVRITGAVPDCQDFDISPDGSQVLFMRRLDDSAPAVGARASNLHVVSADGSGNAALLYGEGADANNGARWTADGKQIIWARTVVGSKVEASQRPSKAFLMIMNADGANSRELLSVSSNVGTARAVLTGGNGCSFSKPSGGFGAFAAALLLGLGLVRRRRQRGVARGPRGAAGRRLGFLALLGLLLLQAAPVQAQSDQERAAARAAANQGGDAFDAGRYEEALGLFQNAERLVHALPHLLYIARSSEKLGKLVEAREAYLKMARENLKPTDPEAFREAQASANKELAQIEPRLASVTLKLEGALAADTTVTVDGQLLSSALLGLPTPTNPGEHTFEAKAPGKLPVSQRITLAEGAKQTLTLTLQSDGSAPSPVGSGAPGSATSSDAPVADQTDAGPSGSSLRVPAYIALGVGVVGVAVGTVFIIGGSGDSSDADKKFNGCLSGNPAGDKACHDPVTTKAVKDLDDSAAKKKTLAVVGFAVGGAALATGVVLLVLDGGKKRSARHEAPRLQPQFGYNYLGLSGSF